jgi:transposase
MEEKLLNTPQFDHSISSQIWYDRLILSEKNCQLFAEEIQHLKEEIAQLKQQIFGKKSEKQKNLSNQEKPEEENQPAGDPQVFDEALIEDVLLQDDKDSDADDQPQGTNPNKEKKARGRKPLPDHLPRTQVIHDLSESEKICPCGGTLNKIGEETSERLEVIPAQLVVIQHVRYKYGCKICSDCVRLAAMPAQAIPKGIPTAGLLSHVCLSKFDDHLPLYRQSEIWERIGVSLSRSTLSAWIIQVGDLVSPLIQLLRHHICKCAYAHADETTAQVFQEKGRSATSTSYMWLYMTGSMPTPDASEVQNGMSIVYEYQPSRKGLCAKEFLTGFQGYLQTDAFSGYQEVTSKNGVIAVGCWAHARRKYVDVYNMAKQPGYASGAIKIIAKLYEYEAKATENGYTIAQRLEMRQKKVAPLLERFKKWLLNAQPKIPPKSPLSKAVNYTLNQWETLIVYTTDGRINIDNNAAERMIRPFAIGRKNWLFMGSPEGAKAAAAIYSLIETAKANGLNPGSYLTHIFSQIPITNAENLKNLLPWNLDLPKEKSAALP